ncbi:hypothetical protein [Novosphingobium sp. Leaf2]|uniref:hypothetical protein n=1 Tax=Novosphingobium sp. Leaf2 TaxID=1735670 RepID=UPI00071254F5|nr:hypothetical protein [Novosphingobium sp. Leaf2]KQM21954.1 hypothetical protein ASE49_01175 [Novosphingobium sp. Leaf2]
MSRPHRFSLARALIGALAFCTMPALAFAIAVMETIAFPFIGAAAKPYHAQPRSIFETRRAGLA